MGLLSGIASFLGDAVDAVSSFFSGGGSGSSSSPSLPSGYSEYLPASHSSTTTNQNTTTTTYTTTTTNYNTTTTTLEPDRVRAAELENERVELVRRAQLDLIEAQTRSRIAQEQARAQGLTAISQAITIMQERLNDIEQRRIAIIEGGTMSAVREAEKFYAELTAEIKHENYAYTTEKLPALLEILGRYEKGSPAHELFMRKVDEDIALQAKHTASQLESVLKRQESIIEDIKATKGIIIEQTAQLTAGISEAVREKIEAIDSGISQGVLALPE